MNCGDHACVTLFSPSLWFCGSWFGNALRAQRKGLIKAGVKAEATTAAADAIDAVLKHLKPDTFTQNMEQLKEEPPDPIAKEMEVPTMYANIKTGALDLKSSVATETTGGKTSTFTKVTFPTPFPSGATVAVVPMVQTFNGPETPGLRIADVTTKGFLIRFNELMAGGKALGDGTHVNERVGWVAFTVDTPGNA